MRVKIYFVVIWNVVDYVNCYIVRLGSAITSMAARVYHSNEVNHQNSLLLQHVYVRSQQCTDIANAMNKVVNTQKAQMKSRRNVKRVTKVVMQIAFSRSTKVTKNGTTYYGNGFRVLRGWGIDHSSVILHRQLSFTENRRQPGVTVTAGGPIEFPTDLNDSSSKAVCS